jgi:hypothetical protein
MQLHMKSEDQSRGAAPEGDTKQIQTRRVSIILLSSTTFSCQLQISGHMDRFP